MDFNCIFIVLMMILFFINDVKEGFKIIWKFLIIIFCEIRFCLFDNYVGWRLNSDWNFGYIGWSLNW